MGTKYTRTKNVITPALLRDIKGFYRNQRYRLVTLTRQQSARLLKAEGVLPFVPDDGQMLRLKTRQGLVFIYDGKATKRTSRAATDKAKRLKKMEQDCKDISESPVASEPVTVWKVCDAPVGYNTSYRYSQDEFNSMIGGMERLVSEMLLMSQEDLAPPNKRTLLRYVKNLMNECDVVLSNLGVVK